MTEIKASFVGYAIDRLGSQLVRKTKKYSTYFEAHEAAEKLGKKHFEKNRYTVQVSMIEESNRLTSHKKRYVNLNEKWGDRVIFDGLEEFAEAVNACGYGPVKSTDLKEGIHYEVIS